MMRRAGLLLYEAEKSVFKMEVKPKISSAVLHSQRTANPHPWMPNYKWTAEVAPSEEDRQAPPSAITLYGGAGFLGRRLTHHLLMQPHVERIRIGTRFPEEREASMSEAWRGKVTYEFCDPTDRHNVLALAEGSQGLVNLHSCGWECELSFREAHVDSAHHIAHAANVVWATRCVYVSSLSAEHEAQSAWCNTKFRGEDATIANFRQSTIFRAGPMFGKGAVAVDRFMRLVGLLPFYPCGNKSYRVAPVYVDDVARAIAYSMVDSHMRGITMECAGPKVYTHKELVKTMMRLKGLLYRRPVVGFHNTWPLWWLSMLTDKLPDSPAGLPQYEALATGIECVPTGDLYSLENIGITPTRLEDGWNQ
eukprot:NODE_764_length_1211_cov_96.950185_g724_i0.p1 GENE.NODE_764_length_1211_cov_96.950185_g724_i0~~NODE_764_length_1211_cov_96.950185_g724_i0.p1  ORF type:complete len:364 (-),score=25.84 NODE_764_length_1211_cov_96.950185_g724_i0:13-1104(-)